MMMMMMIYRKIIVDKKDSLSFQWLSPFFGFSFHLPTPQVTFLGDPAGFHGAGHPGTAGMGYPMESNIVPLCMLPFCIIANRRSSKLVKLVTFLGCDLSFQQIPTTKKKKTVSRSSDCSPLTICRGSSDRCRSRERLDLNICS